MPRSVPTRLAAPATLRLLLLVPLVVALAGCDATAGEDPAEDDPLALTCDGVVEFGPGSVSEFGGVSERHVVEVEGYGVVTDVTSGSSDAPRRIDVTRGQVLAFTYRLTPVGSQRDYERNPALLVASGASANEADRIGTREFARSTHAVEAGRVNTFRGTVTVPDFQQLQGNGPCVERPA